jgi:AraC-like DNA-binding protein
MCIKRSIAVAPELLKSRIAAIWTVNDWANEMGWERSLFSRKFRRCFRVTPKEWLHREKMNSIHIYLTTSPKARQFEIAYDLGFKDEKALYDYVRYHYSCSTGYYIKIIQEGSTDRHKRYMSASHDEKKNEVGIPK